MPVFMSEWIEKLEVSLHELMDPSAAGWTVFLSIVGFTVVISFAAWLKGHTIAVVLVWMLTALTLGWLFAAEPVAELIAGIDTSQNGLVMTIALALTLVLGVAAAIRLATPSSWWAQHRYPSDKYTEAVNRYGYTRIQAR